MRRATRSSRSCTRASSTWIVADQRGRSTPAASTPTSACSTCTASSSSTRQLVRAALHQLREREAPAVLPEDGLRQRGAAVQGGGRAVDAHRVRRQQGHHRPHREHDQRHLPDARLAVPHAQLDGQDVLRRAARAHAKSTSSARPRSPQGSSARRTTTSSSSTLRATSSTSPASSSRRTTTRSTPRGGRMLLKSSKPIIVDICTPEAEPAPRRQEEGRHEASFASVGDKFVKSLKALMTELSRRRRTSCAASSPTRSWCPRRSTARAVIDQLRMSRHARRGAPHPGRLPDAHPVRVIHSRYNIIDAARGRRARAAEFCEVIAEACDVGKKRLRARRQPDVLPDGERPPSSRSCRRRTRRR